MKAAFKYLLFLTAIHVHRRFYICKRPRPPDCPECGRTNRGMQAICATARLPWAAASTGGCTKCSAAKYCQKCVNENLEQTVQNNNYEILIDRNSIGRLGTSKKKSYLLRKGRPGLLLVAPPLAEALGSFALPLVAGTVGLSFCRNSAREENVGPRNCR